MLAVQVIDKSGPGKIHEVILVLHVLGNSTVDQQILVKIEQNGSQLIPCFLENRWSNC